MSLSIQSRSARKVELRYKENEITALYQQFKSDEEIAEALHLAVGHVRAARNGMGLPPHRSASGRLFTPDVDTKVVTLRDDKGMSFRAIGDSLGYPPMDVEVRYRILKRLEGKRGGDPYKDVIPCMLCRKDFLSADRRKIRFCQPCRSDVLPTLECSPYDPDYSRGHAAHLSFASA